TFPHGKYFQRMLQVVRRLVEQHIAEAPPQDGAQHAIKEGVVEVLRLPSQLRHLTRANATEDHELDKGDQVHEPIPAHRERSQVNRDRIELRMNQHGSRAFAVEWAAIIAMRRKQRRGLVQKDLPCRSTNAARPSPRVWPVPPIAP